MSASAKNFEKTGLKTLSFKTAVIAALSLCLISLSLPRQIFATLVGSDPNNLCDLQPIIENVIKVSVQLAGIVLFIFLVIGGFQFLTSGGNSNTLEQAKKTITSALAGIALLAGAWLVLRFIEVFTGVSVTSFIIPCPS